jgi:hypothetical protein
MDFKKLPIWLLSGIVIFPVLIILGAVLFVITLGRFSALAWLILPAIIFEESFEGCCYVASNNQWLNLLFALIFWFVIA